MSVLFWIQSALSLAMLITSIVLPWKLSTWIRGIFPVCIFISLGGFLLVSYLSSLAERRVEIKEGQINLTFKFGKYVLPRIFRESPLLFRITRVIPYRGSGMDFEFLGQGIWLFQVKEGWRWRKLLQLNKMEAEALLSALNKANIEVEAKELSV